MSIARILEDYDKASQDGPIGREGHDTFVKRVNFPTGSFSHSEFPIRFDRWEGGAQLNISFSVNASLEQTQGLVDGVFSMIRETRVPLINVEYDMLWRPENFLGFKSLPYRGGIDISAKTGADHFQAVARGFGLLAGATGTYLDAFDDIISSVEPQYTRLHMQDGLDRDAMPRRKSGFIEGFTFIDLTRGKGKNVHYGKWNTYAQEFVTVPTDQLRAYEQEQHEKIIGARDGNCAIGFFKSYGLVDRLRREKLRDLQNIVRHLKDPIITSDGIGGYVHTINKPSREAGIHSIDITYGESLDAHHNRLEIERQEGELSFTMKLNLNAPVLLGVQEYACKEIGIIIE